MVTLFLSWLNGYLDPYPLQQVVVIFMCIGFVMFLLPPVPGVPVYLAGGVIITNSAMKVRFSCAFHALFTRFSCA